MGSVATLYVRNVPSELYAELKLWAGRSGRSVNAEVLAMLEREVEQRRERGDWLEGFLDFRRRVKLSSEAADLAIASIRAHRDAGL